MPAVSSATMHDFVQIVAQAAEHPRVRQCGWEVYLAQRRRGGVCLLNKDTMREHHVAHFQGRSRKAWPFLKESRPRILLQNSDLCLDSIVLDMGELVEGPVQPSRLLDLTAGIAWECVGVAQPDEGTRLDEPKLVRAVQACQFVTAAEFAACGVDALGTLDYVETDAGFWRPCAGTLPIAPPADPEPDPALALESAEAREIGTFLLRFVHEAARKKK